VHYSFNSTELQLIIFFGLSVLVPFLILILNKYTNYSTLLWSKLYMFRTVTLSIIRMFSPYTQQWYMSYWFADSLRAEWVPSGSFPQAVTKPVWHTPFLFIQWKTPDNGQSNCPKHVEFFSKNKFEKLVYLFGFIITIYHDARSPERQVLIPSTFTHKYQY